jgi:hypothetical protein
MGNGASSGCVPAAPFALDFAGLLARLDASAARQEASAARQEASAARQEASAARQEALLAQVIDTGRATSAALALLVQAEKRRTLERLLIQPTPTRPTSPTSPSSVASSGRASARSPPSAEERFDLKMAVIEFYGLWALPNAEGGERRVYSMLSDVPVDGMRPSMSFKNAILAHIWPSSMARDVVVLRRLLGLPQDFHLHPRNFLILDKFTENAFDADALLLLPARPASGAPASARARVYRLARYLAHKAPDVSEKARADIGALDGRVLFLPGAADGKLPFLRLLAWKAVSALRAGAEADDEAKSVGTADVLWDASLKSGSDTAAQVGRTVEDLASAGIIFAGTGRAQG